MINALIKPFNFLFLGRLKRKSMFASLLVLTLMLSTWIAVATSREVASTKNQRETDDSLVVSRLNSLQSEFKTLEASVNKPAPVINLEGVTQQIAKVSKRLEQLREADSKQLSETVTHAQTTLSHELQSLKEAVTTLKEQSSTVAYLPVNKLPFTILSIDSIQQVSVASVVYDYKTVPLEKGDSLSGWKVVSLDYGKQRIELENARAERIIVTNEHIG